MADISVSAIIYSYSGSPSETKTKSITDIAPTATTAQIAALAQGINGLSTRTYLKTYRVEKKLCDVEGGNDNG